jgi:hypothetical protein
MSPSSSTTTSPCWTPIRSSIALAFYDPRDKRPGLEITSASTWSRTGIALG